MTSEDILLSLASRHPVNDSGAEAKEEPTTIPPHYDTFYPGCLLDLEIEEKEAAVLRAERDAALSGDSRNGTTKSSKKV